MRNTWDDYFMALAKLVATRSTCLRLNVGAVAVKGNHVLATGYNGAPSGIEHCTECIRKKLGIPHGQGLDICNAVHAEQNCITQAAKHGTSLDGCTLYCTHSPCFTCAKLLINVGVKRIVAGTDYPDKKGFDMLDAAGIKLVFAKRVL